MNISLSRMGNVAQGMADMRKSLNDLRAQDEASQREADRRNLMTAEIENQKRVASTMKQLPTGGDGLSDVQGYDVGSYAPDAKPAQAPAPVTGGYTGSGASQADVRKAEPAPAAKPAAAPAAKGRVPTQADVMAVHEQWVKAKGPWYLPTPQSAQGELSRLENLRQQMYQAQLAGKPMPDEAFQYSPAAKTAPAPAVATTPTAAPAPKSQSTKNLPPEKTAAGNGFPTVPPDVQRARDQERLAILKGERGQATPDDSRAALEREIQLAEQKLGQSGGQVAVLPPGQVQAVPPQAQPQKQYAIPQFSPQQQSFYAQQRRQLYDQQMAILNSVNPATPQGFQMAVQARANIDKLRAEEFTAGVQRLATAASSDLNALSRLAELYRRETGHQIRLVSDGNQIVAVGADGRAAFAGDPATLAAKFYGEIDQGIKAKTTEIAAKAREKYLVTQAESAAKSPYDMALQRLKSQQRFAEIDMENAGALTRELAKYNLTKDDVQDMLPHPSSPNHMVLRTKQGTLVVAVPVAVEPATK